MATDYTQGALLELATSLDLELGQVCRTLVLLQGGATVPFIARYRKEHLDGLDEVGIRAIRDGAARIEERDTRRRVILSQLERRGLLSKQLRTELYRARNLTELEDLFMPYREKRRTRAQVAIELGLEPLAKLLNEGRQNLDPYTVARSYVTEHVTDVEAALQGARDIQAEWISENASIRQALRHFFAEKAILTASVVKGKAKEGETYRDYFEWSELAKRVPSHRLLAILRGAREGFLRVSIRPPAAEAIAMMADRLVRRRNAMGEQLLLAVEESYRRLLAPSLETELRNQLKESADDKAIAVFARNLRNLLMAAPLGPQPIVAIDPGLRTGCKTVVLDATGCLVASMVLFLSQGVKAEMEARKALEGVCAKHGIRAIAIGNGTGGREAEACIRGWHLAGVQVIMVDESGASIYSASDLAREEFPNEDITVRGAVSIGRRLIDPLAELVKLDPKTIGVGQYQHDVDQKKLRKKLEEEVVSCVHAVGVEVNSASVQLLRLISGVGPALAANIVAYRETHGRFVDRQQLLRVPRFGKTAFEQGVGFLRVRSGRNPLDASAVHPESYGLVERMAAELGASIKQLMEDEALLEALDLGQFVAGEVGMPTLLDIREELKRPGRDPRPVFVPFAFADDVRTFDDVKMGMVLPGRITNVTNFGAFVDIGVHRDGMVHVSELVNQGQGVIAAMQTVLVRVIGIDRERRRISLSMREVAQSRGQER